MRVLVFVVMMITVAKADDYDYEAIDHCASFYDSDEAGECHHNRLPNTTFNQLYGPNARVCCRENSYRFHDHCQDRPETLSTFACGSRDGSPPQPPQISVSCPLHCITQYVAHEDFEVTTNGKINLRNSSRGVTVGDYCLFYECSDESWKIRAEACLCLEEEKISEIDSQIPSNLKRCCAGHTNLFNLQESSENETGLERINCLFNPQSGSNGKTCPSNFKEIKFDADVNVTDDSISFHLHRHFPGGLPPSPPINISVDSDEYCTGIGFNKRFSIAEPLKPYLVFCQPPCGGKTPCVRTCCSPGENFNMDGSCQPHENSTHLILDRVNQSIPIHLHKVESSERKCAKGFERKPYLEPFIRCGDHFELFLESGNVQLKYLSSTNVLNASEFCLVPNHADIVVAEVCRKIEDFNKLKFYPYILITSTIFLFITLVVYTIYPRLLNPYTRLMRHFTLTMLIAFTVLSVNQLVAFGNVSMTVCRINGFVQQYFFLAMFVFMTAMSTEIWLQMRCQPNTSSRYTKEVVAGYLAPLLILLITLIVELSAPRCAPYRPRFGEIHCFFAEPTSKGIWFFLPIGTLLTINAWMFVGTILKIRKLDRERINPGSDRQGRERMERFLMYAKLFIGMGFFWIFEIIAGLSSKDIHESTWYFPDLLNMLQGFYIFIIFVCKRKVLNIILRKEEILVSSKENDIALHSLRGSNSR